MTGPHTFYAIVPPGLEAVAADELAQLAAHDLQPGEGGVHFTGTMNTLFRVSLRARCATRILLRLRSFRAHSFPELYNKARRIEWQRYLTGAGSVEVSASCHRSRLIHSGRVEQAVGDAIAAAVGEGEGAGSQRIHVRIEQDICTISIDCSGERLDRRGYRLQPGTAPLRETIAAGLLRWLKWQRHEPLLVPMCGSGTLVIEAALLARNAAPGIGHDFPFASWPSLPQKRWQQALERAAGVEGAPAASIAASDIDPAAVEMARRNAERAGVAGDIRFQAEDLFGLQLPEGPGLMLCNPPYGLRIGGGSPDVFYRRLGDLLRDLPAGWRAGVLVPDKRCETVLNLPAERRLRLRHGGRWLDFLEIRNG